MILGLHHLHIVCGDVEKAAKYFEDVLGGKKVHEGKLMGFPFIRIDLAGIFVNLTGTKDGAGQLEAGKGSRGLDHFSLRVANIDETVTEVRKRNAEILAGPGVSDTGNKYLFIQGPEGTRIELIEVT